MHLEIDDEIRQVESRIAGVRTGLRLNSKQAGRKALDGLASPVTLAVALALGFAAGGGLKRKRGDEPPQRRSSDTTRKAAAASGVAGLLMTGAMWFVRAQYGSPVGLAQAILAKFSKKHAPREYPAREFPPRV
jgi:hypothetical protein